MTKEQLTAKIEDLVKQGRQMEVNIHMINGAIQAYQNLIDELEKQDAPQEIDKPEGV
jgi:endonuclease V-like protein UPF0215 family